MCSRTAFLLLAGLVVKCLTRLPPNPSPADDAIESLSLELRDAGALLAELEDLDTDEQKEMAMQLRECSNSVDKRDLDKGQKLILAACIAAALNSGDPSSVPAVAEKYNMCVVRENATEPARLAAEQTAECIKDRGGLLV